MSDIPLSLSLSLSPPGSTEHQPRTMRAKKRRRASSDDVSCELTLSTPSFPSTPGVEPCTSEEASSCSSSTVLNSMGTSQEMDLGPVGLELLAAAADGVHVDKSVILAPSTQRVGLESLDLHVAPSTQHVGLESLDLLVAAAVHVERGVIAASSGQPNTEQFQPRPGTWLEKMHSLNGAKPLRVLVKKLVPTDLTSAHARFLFTQDEEDRGMPKETGPRAERGSKRLLKYLNDVDRAGTRAKGGLPVLLLNRRGEEHRGNSLRFWECSNSYTILGKWLDFVHLNELEAGDVVEVYLFRLPADETAAQAAGGPSSSAATVPTGVDVASVPAKQQGGGPSESLAIVVSSRVSPEEEERRRQENLEEKKARRQQKEAAMKIVRKRKNADGASGR